MGWRVEGGCTHLEQGGRQLVSNDFRHLGSLLQAVRVA